MSVYDLPRARVSLLESNSQSQPDPFGPRTTDFNIRDTKRTLVFLECVFFGRFRASLGQKTIRIETDAQTIDEFLADLESRYPALEGELLATDDENGRDGFAGKTVVSMDGTNVRHLEGLETPLEEGCVVGLAPAGYVG